MPMHYLLDDEEKDVIFTLSLLLSSKQHHKRLDVLLADSFPAALTVKWEMVTDYKEIEPSDHSV